MSESGQPRGVEVPNVVLRGGPLNGEKLSLSAWTDVVRVVNGASHRYRSTGLRDDALPNLVAYSHIGIDLS